MLKSKIESQEKHLKEYQQKLNKGEHLEQSELESMNLAMNDILAYQKILLDEMNEKINTVGTIVKNIRKQGGGTVKDGSSLLTGTNNLLLTIIITGSLIACMLWICSGVDEQQSRKKRKEKVEDDLPPLNNSKKIYLSRWFLFI